MREARALVVLFMVFNLLLCLYVGTRLFQTADFLQSTMNKLKTLTLGILDVPDFNDLKALGVYVVLLGISVFASAIWIYEDDFRIGILELMHKRETEPEHEIGSKEIEFLECPECGKELSEGFKLCPYCGYELKPTTCPACGKEISRDFNLCPFCGKKLKSDNAR